MPYHEAITFTVYVPGILSKSLNSPLKTPHGSVNAFVVSDPALMSTSAPLIGLYAWSTTLPVITIVSPEFITPFCTLKSICNSHNSA